MENKEIIKYQGHFSEDGFKSKLLKIFGKAGRKLVYHALSLYYAYKDKDTPRWAKNVVLGALGYLILPTDLVSDFLPAIGLTDDLAVILAAFASVADNIKDEHKQLADDKIADWFEDSTEPQS